MKSVKALYFKNNFWAFLSVFLLNNALKIRLHYLYICLLIHNERLPRREKIYISLLSVLTARPKHRVYLYTQAFWSERRI